MKLPEDIVLKIEANGNNDLSGVIVQMKVKAGRKNPYFICFPKTDRDGLARLSKRDFVGQFKDHWEMGLMDYNGTPEDADPEVEVSLFDPSWLIENKKLALAWPLLEHEKQRWASREQQYNYMVNNKNSRFSCDPISVNLEKKQKIVLRVKEL